MDGWIVLWPARSVDGRRDGLLVSWTDGIMFGLMGREMSGYTYIWFDGWTDGLMFE
jgi:hypothetical protein